MNLILAGIVANYCPDIQENAIPIPNIINLDMSKYGNYLVGVTPTIGINTEEEDWKRFALEQFFNDE